VISLKSQKTLTFQKGEFSMCEASVQLNQQRLSEPHVMKNNGTYGEQAKQAALLVCKYGRNFLEHNLYWLHNVGGVKSLLIKFPDAIVSISDRIGRETHFSGRVVNGFADFLTPVQVLGKCASPLLELAEAFSKFPAMFEPSDTEVEYIVRNSGDPTGNGYRTKFSIGPLGEIGNRVQSGADWAFSCTGFLRYMEKSGYTSVGKIPLAPIASWAGRIMYVKGFCSEGQFLYKTMWKHNHSEGLKVAWEEVIGSLFRIAFSAAFLSLDIFDTFVPKENRSPWLDTAIFCAGLAPTFIKPVAIRYWPKLVVEPLHRSAPCA
jgi:hypothetical protein